MLLVDMHANRDRQKHKKEKCGQTRPEFKQVKRLHCYTVMYKKWNPLHIELNEEVLKKKKMTA